MNALGSLHSLKVVTLRFLPVILCFCFCNIFFVRDGGPNVLSRLATMASMVENRSFKIDDYVSPNNVWTEDWSKAPNGSFYSNKGPGGMLLGFPIYAVVDGFITFGVSAKEDRNLKRFEYRHLYSIVLSFFLQAVPFALLALLGVYWLESLGVSLSGQYYFLLTFLFGNTASLYVSSFFGHALSAVFVSAALCSLLYGRYALLGLFIGLGVLTEVSTALILLPLFGLILREKNEKAFVFVGLGATIPALLWFFYQQSCFGSIFSIPNQFVNPGFVDTASEKHNLWGILALIPRPQVLMELLVGTKRGLAVTQPWTLLALLVLPYYAFKNKNSLLISLDKRKVTFLSLSSFILLLCLNTQFGGWHGGYAPGPRYLSPILPLLVFPLAAFYDDMNPYLKGMFWSSTLVSIVFYGLVTRTTILIPHVPLWPYLVSNFVLGQ